jgi:hypothetical protein
MDTRIIKRQHSQIAARAGDADQLLATAGNQISPEIIIIIILREDKY